MNYSSMHDILKLLNTHGTGMTKHIVTILFFIVAIALYSMSMVVPGTIFAVLGLLAEGVVVMRLRRSSNPAS